MNHMKAAARIMILLALILAMISGSTMAESYDAGTMRLLRYEGSVEIFVSGGKAIMTTPWTLNFNQCYAVFSADTSAVVNRIALKKLVL